MVKNVELTVTGYAPSYHHKINSPLIRPVVLLDAREFASIYNQVNRLERATQVLAKLGPGFTMHG